MSDPFDSVQEKVLAIFREWVGERARRLDGSEISKDARDAISAALSEGRGAKRARDIAFHMTDWNSDAAFIVALHLFPDKFSSDEIDAGLRLFLCHAPSHIRETCRLTGDTLWTDFSDDDEPSPSE